MNCRKILTVLIGLLTIRPLVAGAGQTLLTNAMQVRELTVSEADGHIPVRLRGVVIGEVEPEGRALVVYDGTACIYLAGPRKLISPIRRGDEVAVEGVSDPGQFAPLVDVLKLHKLGIGKIPKPRHVTFAQMLSGSLDAQYVEISGVVRKCNPHEGNPWQSDMVLETDAHQLQVRINNRHAPGAYVDAKVTLRGLCFSQENDNRQLTSPMLYLPHDVPILVDKDSPPDPYKLLLRSARSLFQFEPHGSYDHRVHLRGVVTYYRPGKFLWIRDRHTGLRAECSQSDPLHPGDEVDVVGFPALGNYAPVLKDAIFRKAAVMPLPMPVFLTNDTSALNHDEDLVSLDARLAAIIPAQDGWTLILGWEHEHLKGLLQFPKGQPLPSSWRIGSEVRVTGICSVTTDTDGPVSGVWEPTTFTLLLRSPADLTVTQMASWWTQERIVRGLGILSALLLLIVGGVILAARHRLRQQAMHRSMAELEFSAILNERNRIAREIHDTVAQGLGAVSMRLELAKKQLSPGANGAAKDLELAHSVVRSTLAETRNSVWHLHSQVLDTDDLATALKNVLQFLTEGTDIQSEFSIRGESHRLPPLIENNLLRVGQEAITNAVKHALPKKISVTLEFLGKMVCLRVRDNGKGFDSKKPPRSEGGFGLIGMSERIKECHGRMILQSSTQSGTEVVLEVPVTN